MFCVKCGQQIPDDSKVCSYCGAVIESATPAAAPAPKKKSSKASFNKKVLFIIAGVVVVVIALVIVLMCLSKPKRIVKKYMKEAEKVAELEEDFDEKYSITSEKAMKALDLWTDKMDEAKEAAEDSKVSWKIGDVKKYGKKDAPTKYYKEIVEDKKGDKDAVKKTAIVEVVSTVKDKDGNKTKSHQFFLLVKTGGKWYLADTTRGEKFGDALDEWKPSEKK